MFTTENTEGFSQEQLNELNEALEILILQGWDEKAASDKLNNLWTEDRWYAEDLLAAMR